MALDIADALERGEVVEVSTDTVFGLAALPSTSGYEQIFEIKRRPREQVLPWLVSGISSLDAYAINVPEYARRLARMFWPGALTIVVSASDAAKRIGEVASNGTIALRCPGDEALLRILERLDGPIACTSANLHGEAPRSCSGASASSIVDCTGAYPVILREGPIPEQVILDVAIYGATLS